MNEDNENMNVDPREGFDTSEVDFNAMALCDEQREEVLVDIALQLMGNGESEAGFKALAKLPLPLTTEEVVTPF
jgi:hypothetical protein